MNTMKMLRLFILIALISSCSKNEHDEIKIRNAETEKSNPNAIKSNETSTTANPDAISCNDASKHVGDSLTVRGYVADVFESEKVSYLNFGKKFPRNIFTCTVFAGSAGSFGELKKYRGRQVEVTGKITSYKNKPQMILWTEAQIRIME
jgi:DNA/RNA endonuclease YhcR with UshA esterase domain